MACLPAIMKAKVTKIHVQNMAFKPNGQEQVQTPCEYMPIYMFSLTLYYNGLKRMRDGRAGDPEPKPMDRLCVC